MLKAKYFLGAAALLLALWVIIGEQITGASSNAVVNARISTTRSPIAGFIELKFEKVGKQFLAGEELVKIEDPAFEVSNLYDLEREQDDLRNDIINKNNILEIIDTEIADMQTYLDKNRDFAIFVNGRNITRSEERIRLFEEIESASVTINGAKLSARSVQNSIELSRANENVEIQREIRRGLLNNFFVGEGLRGLLQLQNDIRDRTMFRSNLLFQLDELKQKGKNLQERISREKMVINSFSKATIKAKSHSLLWENLVSDGERVERGQELFKFIICNSAIVTLSVSSNVYNNLKIGQNAKFFPDNTDLKYEGKIERLAGAGASRIYRNLAIPPSRSNEDRFDVLLSVPKLRDDFHANCAVGNTGRVFFDTRPFDWIRDLIFK